MPQCPICGLYLRKKLNELPDVVVSEHIANGCKGNELSEKKQQKTNRCNFKGCKKSEHVPIICKSCSKTYCLSHRHAEDHKCSLNSTVITNTSGDSNRKLKIEPKPAANSKEMNGRNERLSSQSSGKPSGKKCWLLPRRN